MVNLAHKHYMEWFFGYRPRLLIALLSKELSVASIVRTGKLLLVQTDFASDGFLRGFRVEARQVIPESGQEFVTLTIIFVCTIQIWLSNAVWLCAVRCGA